MTHATKKLERFTESTTVQLPPGTKYAVDELLDFLNAAAGERITRSEFVASALKYYLCYCLDSTSEAEIRAKIDEFIKRVPIDIPKGV